MQALIVFAAVIATAAAGGIVGYSTGNYVQHAHAVGAVAAPGPAVLAAGPLGPVAYAAPAIAKTVAPVAQSSQFVNRAPAARVLAAAPVAVAHAAPVAAYPAGVHYASPYAVRVAPAAYAAPFAAGPVAYGGIAAPALLG